MDKKTKNITIAVIAAVVIGGLYLGYNRWRQQRLASQVLQEMYGGNTAGLLGKIPGIGGISNQVAQEIAKEAAKEEVKQKEEEAKEAAKTPEDRFNETKEAAVIGKMLPAMDSEVRPATEDIFGKVKVTAYGTGYMGGLNKSFTATFKVPRVVTANDLSELSSTLETKGYKTISSGAESEGGNLTLMKGETISLTFSYGNNGEDQTVEAMYMDLASE